MESSLFDLDGYLAALEPPQLRHQGYTYRGRFLSIDEWTRFAEAFRTLNAEKLDTAAEYEARWRELVRRFCDHVFPPQRWLAWRPSVAEVVLAQPFSAQAEAVRSFSKPLARAVGVSAPVPGAKEKPMSQMQDQMTSSPIPPIPS